MAHGIFMPLKEWELDADQGNCPKEYTYVFKAADSAGYTDICDCEGKVAGEPGSEDKGRSICHCAFVPSSTIGKFSDCVWRPEKKWCCRGFQTIENSTEEEGPGEGKEGE